MSDDQHPTRKHGENMGHESSPASSPHPSSASSAMALGLFGFHGSLLPLQFNAGSSNHQQLQQRLAGAPTFSSANGGTTISSGVSSSFTRSRSPSDNESSGMGTTIMPCGARGMPSDHDFQASYNITLHCGGEVAKIPSAIRSY